MEQKNIIPIQHTKQFGIYHWDTFDNETILIAETNTLPQAQRKVRKRYGERISPDGADRVEIVNRNGDIVRSYQVK